MELDQIILKSQDFNDLKNEIKNGNLSKSVLLYSKDSVYSLCFSKTLASLILSNGEIEEIHDLKIKAGSHPDVKIYPQKDKLLVGDSEEIVMESFVKPIFGGKKVFIINNIDLATESAQNKLLKVLEEPPQNVYFILTAASESLVLPTIKSRCNKIELSKLSPLQIKEIFSGRENLDIVSAVSEGLIGKAEALFNKKGLKEYFEDVLSIVTEMKTSKQVLFYSNKIMQSKESYSLFIEILSLIFEDLLLIKSGKNGKFENYRNKLEKVKDEYSFKAICEIEKIFNKATKEIFYNTNQNVVIENLLLNILEVKFVCK